MVLWSQWKRSKMLHSVGKTPENWHLSDCTLMHRRHTASTGSSYASVQIIRVDLTDLFPLGGD